MPGAAADCHRRSATTLVGELWKPTTLGGLLLPLGSGGGDEGADVPTCRCAKDEAKGDRKSAGCCGAARSLKALSFRGGAAVPPLWAGDGAAVAVMAATPDQFALAQLQDSEDCLRARWAH